MKMATERGVCLFIKYPQPGTVKTRLAETMGEPFTSDLYKCFVLDLLNKFKFLDCHLHLFIAPADKLPNAKEWLGHSYPMHAQKGEGLGERMMDAFNTMFKLGYQRTILVGSDSPDMPVVVAREAFKALNNNSSVIAPTRDGGYYLIGFQQYRLCKAVFENVEWSTEQVFQQTMSMFNREGVFPRIMLEWYDVDHIDDLKYLAERHKKPDDPFNRSQTMRFIQNHRQELDFAIDGRN